MECRKQSDKDLSLRTMTSSEHCDDCKNNESRFINEEGYKLIFCFDYQFLIQNNTEKVKQKTYKKQKLKDIMKKVSALRNSGGGSLFIHMKGMFHQNRSMALLNEYIDVHLNNLIEDGGTFASEFFKAWYDGSGIEDSYQCVVLTVADSNSVSTDEFSLGLSVDEECRNIQFKSIQPGIFSSKTLTQLLNYIWDDLRLPKYISSFSKLPTGGSYYIGVTEVGHLGQSGVKFEGIPLPIQDHGKLLRGISDKVKSEIVCFSYQERKFKMIKERNFKIGFHPVEGGNFVVEIAVAPVSGCVFYDTQGPEAYVMTGDRNMERMTFEEWLGAFEKRNKKPCQNCLSSLCDHCWELYAQ